MMRGVINRSGIELVAGNVQQGRDAENRHHELNQLSTESLQLFNLYQAGIAHFVAFMAQRNPIVRSSKSGSAENRAVTRNADGTSAHDPPRSTRLSPVAGPDGFLPGLVR
jgi:hypothetical protein